MLEIVALVILTSKMGAMTGQKGYRSDWFKVMAIGLWFSGELVGGVIGTLATARAGSPLAGTYLVALIGAAVGAVIAVLAANRPELAYRWWRLAAGLLVVVVFVYAALLNPIILGVPMVYALCFIFIGVMLGTMLYQDALDQRPVRAAMLGIAIAGWVISAVGYGTGGMNFVNKNDWVQALGILSAALSVIAILWSVVDAVRNTLPLKPKAIEPVAVQAPQAQQISEQLSTEDRIALAQKRAVGGLCPKCGSAVAPTDTNCPSCRINLAFAREHPGQW